MSPLSRNAELVESWNWYRTAAGTGFQAKEGVRGNELSTGSSARRRKPCRCAGAAPRTGVAASAAAASTSRLRETAARVRTRMVPHGCRHARGSCCPSNEGCLQPGKRVVKPFSGGEHQSVGARPADELD